MFVEFNSDSLIYKVENKDDAKTIKQILIDEMNMSSRGIRRSKSKKLITLNGRYKSLDNLVCVGDTVKVEFEFEENIFPPQNDVEIDVVYEDCDILVINKQPFRVVHPTRRHVDGTIGNGVAYYFNKTGDNRKIRFINRLDRDTSGLMMIAKNSYAQQVISEQMKNNEVKKCYHAIVSGKLSYKSGTINQPIGRESEEDIARCVMIGGLDSITHYKVLNEFESYSLLEILLETGRTHQIRVHMSYIGHTLLGDELYGGNHDLINRQALHCYEMEFKHTRTGEVIGLKCDLPNDMQVLLNL